MLTPAPTRRPKWTAADGPHIRPQASPPTEESEPLPSSPSARDIADALRRSTLRAHHALRDSEGGVETLRSIRDEVAQLEDEIDRLGLRKLRPFVGSLRRRLEVSC